MDEPLAEQPPAPAPDPRRADIEDMVARYQQRKAQAKIAELEAVIAERAARAMREHELAAEGKLVVKDRLPPVAKPKLRGVFTTGWSMVGYWLNLPKEEA